MSNTRMFRFIAVATLCSTALSSLPSTALASTLRPAGRLAIAMQSAGLVQNNDDEAASKKRRDGRTAGSVAICGLAVGLGAALFGNKGAAVGAGLCAVRIAWNIALNKKDKEALTERSLALLEEDGPQQDTWTAPSSGKQLEISTSEATTERRDVDYMVDEGVAQPVSDVRVVSTNYVVVAPRLNFRTAPSAASDNTIRGYFDQGELVEVIGFTPDGNWALVADGGVLVGYAAVRGSGVELLVTPQRAEELRAERSRSPVAAKRKGTRPQPVSAPTVIASNISKTRARPKIITQAGASGELRDASSATTRKTTVAAQTYCKAVVVQLGKDSDQKKGCQGTNGRWNIT